MNEEPILEQALRRVEAPEDLWRRVEQAVSQPPRPPARRAWIPVAAMAALAAGAFALAPPSAEPRAVALHRGWSERGAPLDLYSNDSREVRAFLGSRCGISLKFEAPGKTESTVKPPHIEGARRLGEGAAMVAFQVGPVPATLLVEAGPPVANKQVAAEIAGGFHVFSWHRGKATYTLVSADAQAARAACRLCHAA
ncbi:MAG: hypothetical protein R2729_03185 [Bryobacteraceae bacterium]